MGKERLMSLDALRGITIAGMILVNNPGTWSYIYTPFRHAEWNGLTPTDLIFPTFIFIMGTAMCLSFGQSTGRFGRFVIKIVRRSIVLFLLGIFLSFFSAWLSGKDDIWGNLRIWGVLQRLALTYLGAALIVKFVRRPQNVGTVAFFILVIYYIFLFLGNGFSLSSDNIIAVADRFLIGEQHMYKERLVDGSYIGFEPEGLLSTIPCVAQTLIGYLCGCILQKTNDLRSRLLQLSQIGAILLIMGFLFIDACPLNKKIWSPTFVLVTSGFVSLLLMLLISVVDIDQKRTWVYPFVDFGTNPLFIYVIASLFAKCLNAITIDDVSLQERIYLSIRGMMGDAYASSLAYALLFVSANWVFVHILYRKRIFIKL